MAYCILLIRSLTMLLCRGKLSTVVESLLSNANFDETEMLHFNFVTDEASKKVVEKVMETQTHLNVHIQVLNIIKFHATNNDATSIDL